MLQKTQRLYSFGPFRINVTDCVLSCSGREIKLESKAFDLLAFFAMHPGELVNREEIKLAVWGTSNLDDNNIDQKIATIRRVLSQHDAACEYIQNRRGRGWRFAAEVIEPPVGQPLVKQPGAAPPEQPVPVVPYRFFAGKTTPWLFGIAALAVATITLVPVAVVVVKKFSPVNLQPRTVEYRQLTMDGRPKAGPLVSDGRYVYFSEGTGGEGIGQASLAAVETTGGNVRFPPNPIDPPGPILGIAVNTRDILYGRLNAAAGFTLFIQRQKQHLLEGTAQAGAYARISPDGRSIAYATGTDRTSAIIIFDLAGSPHTRKIPVNGGVRPPAWSPDGGRLRFSALDPVTQIAMFWEVRRDGSGLHQMPMISRPGFYFQDGCWTEDGRNFIYSEKSAAAARLWIRRENSDAGAGQPVQLTNNPMNFDLPTTALGGNTVFARGWLSTNQLDRYDARLGEFIPFWEDVLAADVSFSNDGVWAAYRRLTDDTLWVSRSGGSDRRQITYSPLRAYQPHWSPDGKRIAFMGQAANQPSRVFIVGAFGGQPQAVKPGDSLEQGVPSWSGDGRYLAFGELRQRRSDDDMQIRVIDLSTQRETILPGSKAKWSPRWSPNGRYIAAVATNSASLTLFDCARRLWTPLVTARSIDDPVWSLDGRFVHFSALTGEDGGRTLFRVRIADAVIERLAPYPPSQVRWSGVSPDGSPLVLNSRRIEEIYAIDFK